MTDRTRNTPTLKRLRNQAVEVKFDGGTLTSDGGLLLLREVDQRLKLIERIARVIPDPRDPRYIVHTQVEMLTSRKKVSAYIRFSSRESVEGLANG